MNASVKANELRAKLFNLIEEFKDFQLAVQNGGGDVDLRTEAAGQVDSASCALAQVYDDLGDFFLDAARDESSYPITA